MKKEKLKMPKGISKKNYKFETYYPGKDYKVGVTPEEKERLKGSFFNPAQEESRLTKDFMFFSAGMDTQKNKMKKWSLWQLLKFRYGRKS